MPSDPLKHSLDHFHDEIAADPDIQDALRRLNELHVSDPREQVIDDEDERRRLFRGLAIWLSVGILLWVGVLWLIAEIAENWNW